MIKKESVPEEFYKGDRERPIAWRVDDLIFQLNKLPPDMLIKQTKCVKGFGDGVQLTVYNINTSPFLEFEEVDDD